MKMEGFPSTWCPPRLVIPAHAGIQVCCAELAWIPAFAGMTEPRRASWFSSPNGYFQRRHEEHEGKKFKRKKRKEFHAVVAYAENQVVRPLSMKSNLDLARPFVRKRVLEGVSQDLIEDQAYGNRQVEFHPCASQLRLPAHSTARCAGRRRSVVGCEVLF